MTDAELERALRAYGRRRPFRLFLLEFFSGTQVVVDHPDGIALFNQLWLYRGPQQSGRQKAAVDIVGQDEFNCGESF